MILHYKWMILVTTTLNYEISNYEISTVLKPSVYLRPKSTTSFCKSDLYMELFTAKNSKSKGTLFNFSISIFNVKLGHLKSEFLFVMYWSHLN